MTAALRERLEEKLPCMWQTPQGWPVAEDRTLACHGDSHIPGCPAHYRPTLLALIADARAKERERIASCIEELVLYNADAAAHAIRTLPEADDGPVRSLGQGDENGR